MSDRGDESLSKIEEAQAALRESIEFAKGLAEQSDRLIQKYHDEIEKGTPSPPAPPTRAP